MDWARVATGSAIVLVDSSGRVLLVRRAYPPHDWVLPGGNAEPGESPVETMRREPQVETGLSVEPEQLMGVYYQDDHAAGEFIHFVFRASAADGVAIEPQAAEVAEDGFFAPEALPEPMSVSTRLRLTQALLPEPQPLPVRLPPRAE
jgi:8-oxo-dGTP pyrophosphatase MutT (NUDIX family)